MLIEKKVDIWMGWIILFVFFFTQRFMISGLGRLVYAFIFYLSPLIFLSLDTNVGRECIPIESGGETWKP